MKMAVAIPAYNCESQIVRLLSELDPVLSSYPQIESVFIIENRSTDGTLAAAISAAQQLENRHKVSIYQNPENFGLGGTHKIAFTLCKAHQLSHVIVLHGDHQASPRDLPSLLQELKSNPHCNILGSRFSDLSRLSGYSVTRTFGNLVLNFLYSAATRTKISDLGSGLNLFSVQSLNENAYQQFDNSFTFNMDLLLYFVREKIAFRYVPISWTTEDQVSNARTFAVGLTTLKKLFFWIAKTEIKNPNRTESIRIFPSAR